MNAAVKSYFDAVAATRRERLVTLHELILHLFPDICVSMRYKMPTYELNDGWVAIANQKHHIAVYTCSAAHIVEFKQHHPEIKTGKGCINFRDRDVLPLQALEQVIVHAILHPKEA